MTNGKPPRYSYRKLRAVIEHSAKSFARHNMMVYAMALAYRGLFALVPFAIFLVVGVSLLRVGADFEWLNEQGPPGYRAGSRNLSRAFWGRSSDRTTARCSSPASPWPSGRSRRAPGS